MSVNKKIILSKSLLNFIRKYFTLIDIYYDEESVDVFFTFNVFYRENKNLFEVNDFELEFFRDSVGVKLINENIIESFTRNEIENYDKKSLNKRNSYFTYLKNHLREILNDMESSIMKDEENVLLIPTARILYNICEREDLPDWIEILAMGNSEYMDKLLDIAREDIEYERMNKL